ncbi:MAG: MFS transporter [Rhodospirillales bacterium]|nr:MFS transporter [Rhodospirillales bacterium]
MSENTYLPPIADQPDSAYSWLRLVISLGLSTIGGVGLWSVVVVLPTIEAEFGVDRAGASLPYTATMIGFAMGGIYMGRLADKRGVAVPLVFSAVMMFVGYMAAAYAENIWQFMIAQALFIGMLGSSASFAPLVADVSHWFVKRRGLAIAIVASGNYLSGTIWPPMLTYGIEQVGWRASYMGIAVICLVTMIPLALLLRRRPNLDATPANGNGVREQYRLNLSPRALQSILVIAGIACCVAMSMPQVHIVAYCGDLGYGVARGAEMLSLMLGFGIVSRLVSGMIGDRIGGVGTLIIGSVLQCLALLFYIPFDGLASLYIVSAFFGLAQGGIVPSYALIVREYLPAKEAGARVSLVLMATVVGMALGGWLSGEIYDLTGSYRAAFLNGIAWNLLNMSIAVWLLIGQFKSRRKYA